MTYMLTEVLRAIKSLFITTPLGNTQPSPYLDAIVRLRNRAKPDKGIYGDIGRIYSVTNTIDEYIEVLERAIDCVKNEKVFKFDDPDFSIKSIPLRKWYLNRKGEFIDPESRFTRFIEKACELLELFEVVELQPPTSVAMERSRERLLLLINNLIDISNQ